MNVWYSVVAAAAVLALAAPDTAAARTGGDTIVVANRSTASVTIYAPPYSRPSTTLASGAYAHGAPPVALAFDPVLNLLFVGAGNEVQIYRRPFTSASKPVRVIHEIAPVVALGVEHRFYHDGLLEVATAGAHGGVQAYSGGDAFGGPALGRVDDALAETMAFDESGHLFVADRRQSDGSVLILLPLTGRAFAPPIGHFLLGPSALAFDSTGDLWVGNYDVAGDGTRSGVASFAPPFSSPNARIPDEGGERGSGWGAAKLLFGRDGSLFVMRVGDVGLLVPPYSARSRKILTCAQSSGACDPFDMTIDSHGDAIVATRSLSCGAPGALRIFSPPFTSDQTPAAIVTQGIACPAAVIAVP